MRAAVVTAPEQTPVAGEFADPAEKPGRRIVELVAAGIHPIVRSLAAGRHYGSTDAYPLIPGVDAVARTPEGALVYTGYAEAPYGTIAERISVPEAMGFPLPEGADPLAVAAGMNPGAASWLPLRKRVDEIGALGTVLVLGATGMAGRLAVQNARVLGAERVIAVGRNAEALAGLAAEGAVTAALTGEREADAAAIAGALDGGSPSLVLDFVWGPVAEAAFAALGRRGLDEDEGDISYVEIGSLAGAEAAVPAALLRSRRIRIVGSGAGSSSLADILRELGGYLDVIAAGRVGVPVRSFPLSRVEEAWRHAETHAGERVVVVPD